MPVHLLRSSVRHTGLFYPRPLEHMKGTRCPGCFSDSTRLTYHEFLARCEEVHGDFYDYRYLSYGRASDTILVVCPAHGPFTVRAESHANGTKCKKCADAGQAKTTEEFIEEARTLHGDTYDYSRVHYTGQLDKIEIGCPIHGPFTKTPFAHTVAKSGCPTCKESVGEREVRLFLERRGLEFTREYKLPPYKYRWDFYVPQYDLYIEYNGIQHYMPVERFGGMEGHLSCVERDKQKQELVDVSGGTQLTISCLDKRTTEEILTEHFETIEG